MGMFDEVKFNCPVCSLEILEQSKAGDCALRRYDSNEVPLGIADDVSKNRIHCESCDKSFVAIIAGTKTVAEMKLYDM